MRRRRRAVCGRIGKAREGDARRVGGNGNGGQRRQIGAVALRGEAAFVIVPGLRRLLAVAGMSRSQVVGAEHGESGVETAGFNCPGVSERRCKALHDQRIGERRSHDSAVFRQICAKELHVLRLTLG